MTWVKTGTEFPEDAARNGLTDHAYRTHHEAITWLYHVEATDMRIPKHLVRRFAGSDQWETAVKDLVASGYWRDDGDAWVVEHHADVVRQSLGAQLKKREIERDRQRQKRGSVTRDVGTDVGTNVSATQTDRQVLT